MLLVCSVCSAKLRCRETGFFIKDGYDIRQGDLWECPERCSTVIADFGEPFGEAEAPQLYARVMAALETGDVPYVSRKTLQERF